MKTGLHLDSARNIIRNVLQKCNIFFFAYYARNWLVGYYIVEFEQHGEDRAKYGEKLINRLAENINRKGFEPRRLREFRQLYIIYSLLGCEVAKYIKVNQLLLPESEASTIWRSPSAKLEDWATPADKLFNRLNYSCLL